MELKKTLKQIGIELSSLIEEYEKEIDTAYVKNAFELSIAFKVKIVKNDGKIIIKPSIEFYPEPKLKSEPYIVKVDEKQIGFPFEEKFSIIKKTSLAKTKPSLPIVDEKQKNEFK